MNEKLFIMKLQNDLSELTQQRVHFQGNFRSEMSWAKVLFKNR